MTNDTVIAAIGIALVILVIVAIPRIVRQRRGGSGGFGAGGTTIVPVGTAGVVRTDLAPSGVVLAAGEPWTARSRDGAVIPAGTAVQVVAQDGITLIVQITGSVDPTER